MSNLRDKTKEVTIQCEDCAERVVFMQHNWEYMHDGDVDYEICIEDCYCGGEDRGFFGRLKRSWRAFWAKPVYYSGIYVEDPERVRKFLCDCLALMDDEIGV